MTQINQRTLEIEQWRRLAQQLRVDSVRSSSAAGSGHPIGVGIALAGKYLDKVPYRVWVLCGDSEMAEGSMWEAIAHAAFYKLGNLVAILDMNRLGQTRETMDGWNGEAYAERMRAFGWRAIQIDG